MNKYILISYNEIANKINFTGKSINSPSVKLSETEFDIELFTSKKEANKTARNFPKENGYVNTVVKIN